MKKQKSYTTSFNELEQLINEIESNETPIEQLALKIKRAMDLIEDCRKYLRDFDDSVKNSLKAIEE